MKKHSWTWAYGYRICSFCGAFVRPSEIQKANTLREMKPAGNFPWVPALRLPPCRRELPR